MALRAIHAPAVAMHLMGQRIGHAAAHGLQFVDGKFDTVFVAAGATGEAGVNGRGHERRAQLAHHGGRGMRQNKGEGGGARNVTA